MYAAPTKIRRYKRGNMFPACWTSMTRSKTRTEQSLPHDRESTSVRNLQHLMIAKCATWNAGGYVWTSLHAHTLMDDLGDLYQTPIGFALGCIEADFCNEPFVESFWRDLHHTLEGFLYEKSEYEKRKHLSGNEMKQFCKSKISTSQELIPTKYCLDVVRIRRSFVKVWRNSTC